MLDTLLAEGLGYTFTKLRNGGIVSEGADAMIRRTAFIAAWVYDTQRVSTLDLMDPSRKIVTIGHDDSHPPPLLIVTPSMSPVRHKRTCAPLKSPNVSTLSVSEYQPASPTPSQRDFPENERPSSWAPADACEPVLKRPKYPSPCAVTRSPQSEPTLVVPTEQPHGEPLFSSAGFFAGSTSASPAIISKSDFYCHPRTDR